MIISTENDIKKETITNKKVSYGYDRHVRSWCVLALDEEGKEIASSYVYSYHEALLEVKRFKEWYSIDVAEKVKAY
jgi:hypothetical protein